MCLHVYKRQTYLGLDPGDGEVPTPATRTTCGSQEGEEGHERTEGPDVQRGSVVQGSPWKQKREESGLE